MSQVISSMKTSLVWHVTGGEGAGEKISIALVKAGKTLIGSAWNGAGSNPPLIAGIKPPWIAIMRWYAA